MQAKDWEIVVGLHRELDNLVEHIDDLQNKTIDLKKELKKHHDLVKTVHLFIVCYDGCQKLYPAYSDMKEAFEKLNTSGDEDVN